MELSKPQEKNQMNFNEHLLRIRKASHQTQQALADYLNISVQSVSKWEKGTASPSIEYLPQIARFFHCSVNAFFSEYELQLTEKFAAPLDDKYVLALYEEILHQQNVLKSNPEWPDTEFVDNAYPFESMFLPGLYEFLKTHTHVTARDLQENLFIGYGLAADIIYALVEMGIVDNKIGKEIVKEKIDLILPYVNENTKK